jgi:succinate dehydrogenase / fumarate reductase membrane anchor subunit
METPLGAVRGLGSAREGAGNWWHERLSSIATLLLSIWLLVSLLRLPSLDYGVVAEWLSSIINASAMLLFVVSSFWHIRLGMKVIIEDYVHEEGSKTFALLLLNFAVAVALAIAVVALLKLAVGGSAA